MPKTPKLSAPGRKVVTEARLASLLARFAKAADASLGVKMAEMEARLRAEFGTGAEYVVAPPASEPRTTEAL